MKILKHLAWLLILMMVFASCKKPDEGNYWGIFYLNIDTDSDMPDKFLREMILVELKRGHYQIYTPENVPAGNLNVKNGKVDGWYFDDYLVLSWMHAYHEEIDTLQLSGIWKYADHSSRFTGQVTTKYKTVFQFPNDPPYYLSSASGTFEIYN